MYTQAMDIPDDSGKKLAAVSNAPSDQEAAFEARIDADGRIEPQDWMPDAYRRTLVR